MSLGGGGDCEVELIGAVSCKNILSLVYLKSVRLIQHVYTSAQVLTCGSYSILSICRVSPYSTAIATVFNLGSILRQYRLPCAVLMINNLWISRKIYHFV